MVSWTTSSEQKQTWRLCFLWHSSLQNTDNYPPKNSEISVETFA